MADTNIDVAQQMLGSKPTSTAGDIPLEHMDYDYIGKCTNAKELEKIYKVLKSGKEGHYPDLINFCEKRIADIAPQSKVLRKDTRPATEYDLGQEEWDQIQTDVEDWQNDITEKDKTLKEEGEGEQLPPVRNRGTINTQGKKNESSNQDWGKPSEERIKGSDFRRWDKYDAEAEAAKIEDGSKYNDLKAAAEDLAKSRSVGAKDMIDTSGMSDREREQVANREKDKGNEAFRAGDYKEAIHYYSRSLSVVPSAPALNNRSLARIKLGIYPGAIEDASEVLELEPSNIKALLRRGTARKSMKYYDQALVDLKSVIRLEPNNKQALDLVGDIEKKLEKTETSDSAEAEQQLPNGDAKQKSGGRRLVIEEVEADDSEEEEEEEEEGGDRIEKAVREAVGEKVQNLNEKIVQGMETIGGAQGLVNESETDGCVASKPPQEPSAHGVQKGGKTDPKGGKAAPAGQEGGAKPEEKVQAPPPLPPRPLPPAVVALKDAGNDLFKKGQYGEANEKYSRAIGKLETDKDSYTTSLAALYGNRASCSLRSGDPKTCIVDCDSALELNPVNVKTYMKRAQAYEAMERYGHAYVDYKSAMNFDHYNSNAQNGASRMAVILKDQRGSEWKDKLPSKPKSPSTWLPAYANNALMGPPTTTTPSSEGSVPRTSPSIAPTTATASKDSVAPRSTASSTTPSTPPTTANKAATSQTTGTTKASAATSTTESPSATSTGKSSAKSTAKASAGTSTKSSDAAAAAKKTNEKEEKPQPVTKEGQFQEFKSIGNEQVKKGEFQNAVSCYTCCIEVDPSQAVSYSNRALCYLKLSKPDKAIWDCNEALKREPKMVKALYRRGQARRMLGQYQDSARDLTDLLKIEPHNAPAKKELDQVKDAWRKELREKQSQTPKESSKPREKKSGKRINIQEITDSDEEETGDWRAKLTSNSKLGGKQAPSLASLGGEGKSPKDSQERDTKAGKENKPTSPSNGMPSSPKKMTAYEFMHEWSSLKKKKNIEPYAALLRRVAPNDIPKVLSNKLDGDMLGKILNASANHLVDEDPEFTYQLLNKLRCVDRFKTITMFLSPMDKANLQRCINSISAKPNVCKEDEVRKLKKAYSL